MIARVASAIARGTQRHAGRVQRVRDAVGEQRVDAGPLERGSRATTRRARPGRARGRRRRRGGSRRTTPAKVPSRRLMPELRRRHGGHAPLRREERRARCSARPSRAGSRRSACRATPAGARPRARPTPPRRTTCPARIALARGEQVRVARSPPRRGTAMTSSTTSRLSTAGTKPAPMPWMRCGPGGPPESTADDAGSTATTQRRRVALALSASPTPVIVPPVPTPRDEHVDPAVERAQDLGARCRCRCASGLAGLENWSGRNDVGVARHRAGGVDGLVHAAERLDHLDARAVEAQQRLALAAHALGQEDREVVALGRAAEGERDAGVARASPRRSSSGPGSMRPSASAASIIATPMRSFTEPPGLKASSLP